MAALVLGSIIFTEYQIPERIPYGGKQAAIAHKLIGGARVVDAMGPDEDDLTWSGRFQGSNALAQANQLDALRAAGVKVPLVFADRMYMVLITSAVLNYERPYQIPYTVTCLAVSSPNIGGFDQTVPSIDSLVSDDMASVTDLAAQFADNVF